MIRPESQIVPVEAKTSGRRLAFARWLTQPGHPLTARVIVNRLWLHHFGEGLVSTPEDFGTLGAAPSNPELLDWLACELVENGWSLKHLQRLILLSSTYRQRAAGEDRAPWRQRLRRLEAEPLRDAMLAAAGALDRRFYGYPIPVARRPDGEVTIADGQNDRRRSIYIQVLRGNPLTMLQAHDQPVMETNCTRRGRSTVSTQALTILNSDVVVGYAQTFADRLLRESPAQPLEGLHEIAFGRHASPDEMDELRRFVAKQAALYESLGDNGDAARRRALSDVCHLVLASNEFVYID